jgi:hypothetical protein
VKKKNGIWTFLAITIILMILSACTHHITPVEYPVDPLMIPEFSGNNPIKINNAQQQTEEILLGTNIGHQFRGKLIEFTDTAIATLKTELDKRGIPITNDAEKVLNLCVTKVNFKSRFTGFWCDVEIKVETGDGYIAQVDGHDSNAWILFPAIHGALNHAVVAVLNDDKVLEYLKR